VKLATGVNFTNILQAAFCMKVFCVVFICLQFVFIIFWQKEISPKAAHRMLVKLATVQLQFLHLCSDVPSISKSLLRFRQDHWQEISLFADDFQRNAEIDKCVKRFVAKKILNI